VVVGVVALVEVVVVDAFIAAQTHATTWRFFSQHFVPFGVHALTMAPVTAPVVSPVGHLRVTLRDTVAGIPQNEPPSSPDSSESLELLLPLRNGPLPPNGPLP